MLCRFPRCRVTFVGLTEGVLPSLVCGPYAADLLAIDMHCVFAVRVGNGAYGDAHQILVSKFFLYRVNHRFSCWILLSVELLVSIRLSS